MLLQLSITISVYVTEILFQTCSKDGGNNGRSTVCLTWKHKFSILCVTTAISLFAPELCCIFACMFQTCPEAGVGNDGGSSVSLTCPTCRTVIPVPPGGVTQFQVTVKAPDCSIL